jgi:cytochrome c biogenesis protein CcmG/thiol:disulfide interchange protein DsbE
MSRGRVIGLAVLAAVICGVVAAEVVTAGGGAAARPAPELPHEVLAGPPTDLESLRGKPALVNFWASWCEPCKEEAPELRRFDRSLGSRATLLGVDWGEDAAPAQSFIARSGWKYPVLRDPSQKVGLAYGFSGLPTTYVLDADGDIVQTLQGPQTAATLRQALATVD